MSENNIPTLSIEQTKKAVMVLVGIAVLFAVAWVLWGFRINVPQAHVLVLMKKFGQNLKPEQIIALDPSEKGIQYDVKSEGWHWYSSFLWRREIHPATIIKASQLGVLIRQYGKQIPENEVIANPLDLKNPSREDTKGVVAEVLKPGKYNLNPYAYKVEIHPVSQIPAGHVGIVVNKVGTDGDGFTYLAKNGNKGILPDVREPGTYYLNPYVHEVIPYNIRVQKTDFDDQNEISFMSFDSYEVKLNATVEWRVDRKRAPEVFISIGDLKEVEKKVVIPYARSFCRIIGSQSYAKEYISGVSRQEIQEKFRKMLKDKAAEFGVVVNSVLIKKIIPPKVLREIINMRGLEKEKREKYIKEIEKVKSDARVAKRREEIKQGQAKVEENIKKQMALTKMKGDRKIFLQKATKEKAIAKVNLNVANVEKETIVEKGRAKIQKNFNLREAEVEAMRRKVEAFGSGKAYARYIFNQRIALQTIFANDDSPLADMVNQLGTVEGGQR